MRLINAGLFVLTLTIVEAFGVKKGKGGKGAGKGADKGAGKGVGNGNGPKIGTKGKNGDGGKFPGEGKKPGTKGAKHSNMDTDPSNLMEDIVYDCTFGSLNEVQ